MTRYVWSEKEKFKMAFKNSKHEGGGEMAGEKMSEKVLRLAKIPDQIRNICTCAHIDKA